LHCKINDNFSEKVTKTSWFRRYLGQDDNYSDYVLNTSNFSEGDAFMILNPANDLLDDEFIRV
jgi:hypothetical protein